MSIRIPRRNAEGRLCYDAINVRLLIMVAAFGIRPVILLDLAVAVPVEALALSASMLFVGFTFFFAAETSVYQIGFWFSFGRDRMSARMRRRYRLGNSGNASRATDQLER